MKRERIIALLSSVEMMGGDTLSEVLAASEIAAIADALESMAEIAFVSDAQVVATAPCLDFLVDDWRPPARMGLA